MRPLLLSILFFTGFLSTNAQADTIRYKQFGDSSEFSELYLNPDRSFRFQHYNMRSCWTWYSVYGSWKTENAKLIFTDTILWEEDRVVIDTVVTNDIMVRITVKDDTGLPLVGVEITYNPLWSEETSTYKTDQKGQVIINKALIKRQQNPKINDNKATFVIKYNNQKCRECSFGTSFELDYDKITITVRQNPKEEEIYRTTVYTVNGDRIFFDDQTYSTDKGYSKQSWGNFENISQITTGNKVLPKAGLK